MESQCVGLAHALGVEPVLKRVRLRAPWRQLTPYFRLGQSVGFAQESDRLEPPWPDLVIATGRGSIAASLFIRAKARRAGERTVIVQLQKPGLAPACFDLVVTPMHDGLQGENVVETFGALHGVTQQSVLEGAERLAPHVTDLPPPYVGVLVGGANAAFDFRPRDAKQLAESLAIAAGRIGGSLLITPSRRTSPASRDAFRSALASAKTPNFFWEGEGFNPYFGILGLSEYLVVTCDSVNMVSEAVATGKPVYVAALPGGTAKFARFHALMQKGGLTRPFVGALERYAYLPPDDMHRVTGRIRELVGAAKGAN